MTAVQALHANWRKPFLNESRDYFKLVWPLVISSLVSMSISITDVVMMGWISPTALAAGAAASDFYSIVFYLAAGIVGGMTPLMAQAKGARRYRDVRLALQQGFWVAATVSLPGLVLVWNAELFLAWLGVKHNIITTATPYAHMMAITVIPMLGVSIWHHFLSVHNRTRVIFYVTALGLPANALGNYAFMFGNFGAPELGLAGAGVASLMSTSLMFLVLAVYVLRSRLGRYRPFARMWRPHWPMIRETVRIGAPIGLLNLGEMGVFLFATVIMGVFGAEALAAHAVAIRMAGVVYAIPLGLSQAATVRVGYAIGADQHDQARVAAVTGLVWAIVVGLAYVVLLWTFAAPIAGLFLSEATTSALILAQATTLLIVLALLQPLSNIGTVSAGALRGIKDTQVPSAISIGGHWLIGFVLSYVLAFHFDLQALGIWIGLGVGSAAVGIAMLARLWWAWNAPARLPAQVAYA